MNVEVKSQAELEKALERPGVVPVCVGRATFRVRGTSRVVASDSSSVRAYGSSSVVAYGSSSVVASGSSSVMAYGSSSVRAYGSSSVMASDSSSVRAYGSSSVRASGSSSVMASDSSSVRATPHVAIQRHGASATVRGGVLIQIPEITNADEWCSYYGVDVKRGVAILYKAVDDEFCSDYNRFAYRPGTKPQAPDWDGGVQERGGGLHFSPRPVLALEFMRNAKHFVACPVRVKDIVVHRDASLPQKVKAPGVCRPVYEVTIDGEPIAPAAA
jgi:hypothetical protein